jgi:putative heme-binding domain-containing protein
VQRELRDRPQDEVVAAVKNWVATIAANDPLHDRLLTEAMWALAGQRAVDLELFKQVAAAEDPNARAAAAHTLADQRAIVPEAFAMLAQMVNDPHPRVRLEAVRGLSYFPTPESVEAALGVLKHPMDGELTFTLESALGSLRPAWEQAERQATPLAVDDPAAAAFLARVAAGNDRGREVNALISSIIERYDHEGHRTTVMSRLNALDGNAEEGAKVFKRACQACHRVGDDGADFGPNLSDVGKRLRLDEILESVLFPNKKIDPKYRATNILTIDGKAVSGLVVGEDDNAISILVGQGTLQKIPQEDVDIREELDVSSMPERLQEGMSGIEFLDLLEFLAVQQTAPTPPAETVGAGSGRE